MGVESCAAPQTEETPYVGPTGRVPDGREWTEKAAEVGEGGETGETYIVAIRG